MARLVLPPHVAHAIADGRVTQHRRPVDTSQPRLVRRTQHGGSHAHLSRPWEPVDGRTLAVIRSNDTRKPAVPRCHVEITSHDQQRHGNIDAAARRAHGHKTAAAYAKAWIAVHDTGWLWKHTEDLRGPDHTLTDAAQLLADNDATDRFDARWADKPVWVLHLQLIATPPQYLARAHQHGAEKLGYTGSPGDAFDTETDSFGRTRALDVIDPDHLDFKWAREANVRHERDRPTRRRRAA